MGAKIEVYGVRVQEEYNRLANARYKQLLKEVRMAKRSNPKPSKPVKPHGHGSCK